ncbi:WecB/TagA/CpsF family glycosyltransferase [Shinella sp. CPCC 101442]|uniref:WecB/TagA/CpsF family glycosyltransferase n=1 Tax=Shinella sp. CPCC 101442 TaxID=2932265 RepID=UPI0021527202|nr:WecB/TagA/CpsF family glycosyltransferase [Shinella sp. CPCC 101442]MCR6502410.1 WecB/TagA/CpsF family glycosyltransferase [Shinella sp. CPCC 101442]
MSGERRLLFGMYMDPLRMEEAIERCRTAIRTRQRMLVGVLNAAKIVNLRRNAMLRNSLIECDMIVADGQAVVWASKLLGRPLPERIAGIDLFVRLLALADAERRSVALLGARPEVLTAMETAIRARYPNLTISYSHHGYFQPEESEGIASDIRECGADMLFLGMVSPKKEVFLATYGPSLGVPVLHGVGGSFDVLAGLTRRAPPLWQKLGMEWAYRVLQEPRRLWWRYLSTNSSFLRLLAREMVNPTRPFEHEDEQVVVKFERRATMSGERRA